jgi:hypothetical protein
MKIMDRFLQVLNSLDPISLSEMDAVKLLDRTDTKFLFHRSKLEQVLNGVKDHYRVLEINNVRNNAYETLYYDTPGFELYLKHHNDRSNRYKIRYRKYVGSDLNFFEIKFKNNKGRTIKSRIQRSEVEMEIRGKAKALLEDTTHYTSEMLRPVFWVNYSRMTLVSRNFSERLTIDTFLTFKNECSSVSFDNLIIAELKQEKASLRSPFARLMTEGRIKQNSLSKYCLGVTQLIDDVKKNNFKPKLLTLNKILHGAA